MVKSITLTASMRSNLNSLKNIAKQMNTTQERLSTGKKVNSAIDNASSYYQARALTNRASDLDALLDAMGQGIQTIQAATQGLTSGVSFLEQASAIATEALTTNAIPTREWFEAQVGENGAVVTTAQELKDAINSGKETICVYGKIDYFDNENLSLTAGQKIVGTEYYTGYTGQERFSQLNCRKIILRDTSSISDLTIKTKAKDTMNYYAINSYGDNSINNLTLTSTSELSDEGVFTAGIIAFSSNLELSGTIIINNSSNVDQVHGIYNYKGATINSTADIYTNSIRSANSALNINGGSLNLSTDFSVISSSFYLAENAAVNVSSTVWLLSNSVATVLGKINVVSKNDGIRLQSGSTLMFMSSSVINIKATGPSFGVYSGNLILSAGAEINTKDNSGEAYLITDRYLTLSSSTNGAELKTKDCVKDNSVKVKIDWDNWQPVKDAPKSTSSDVDSQQYAEILNQYDKLINDSSYQGVNLLKNEKLNVIFNETRNNKLTVQGQDMSSAALGLTKAEWTTQGDIANSIQELLAAVNKIRTFQSELGNNYSIIQTRQNFTEALTDVLETGADNLVLADMNEESANYLALQTRQQLATNALSLAANSAQSVLALFG